MVLCLKAWESRSLPGLHGARWFAFGEQKPENQKPEVRRFSGLVQEPSFTHHEPRQRLLASDFWLLTSVARVSATDAGWSSPVARQAHNLKVVGSNPTPAPTTTDVRLRSTELYPNLGDAALGQAAATPA